MIREEDIVAAAPFTGTLGIRFPVLEASQVRAELPWRQGLSTIGGGLHGGALMSLADIAATVCAVLNVGEGSVTATVESSSYFLRPVSGAATAIARPLRVGRRTIFVTAEVLDENGELCGHTSQVQAVLGRDSGNTG